MGTSFSKTDINNIYKNQNDMVTNASQDCIVSQISGIHNIDYRFENTEIGDIVIAQQTTVDPVCVFDNSVAMVAKSILEQLSEVDNNDAGIIPINPLGLNIDITNIRNETELGTYIETNIKQLCSFSSESQISNVRMTFINSKGGDIILEQEGSITGQCMLANLATIQTQVEASQSGDADNGKVRDLTTMIVIIVIIIAVVIVFVALLGALRGKKKKDGDVNICDELKGEEKALCELQKVEGGNPTQNLDQYMTQYSEFMKTAQSMGMTSVPKV